MTNKPEPPPTLSDLMAAAREQQERFKAEREAAVAAAQAEMAAMLAACDDRDLETLLVQHSHMMNALLHQTVQKNAGPGLTPEALNLILKTNRECRQSITALSRVRTETQKMETQKNKNYGKRNDSSGKLYDGDGRLIYNFSKEDSDGGTTLD